jgi:hypothetical protein
MLYRRVAGNPIYQACVEVFFYTDGPDEYRLAETPTISPGTGRSIASKRRPEWMGSWPGWVMGELLESPGEQQTEIALHTSSGNERPTRT